MSERLRTLKETVRKDCRSSANRLDAAFYELHRVNVEKHALELCRHVTVDKELAGLAAFLDILCI